jgi:hypothetical protein
MDCPAVGFRPPLYGYCRWLPGQHTYKGDTEIGRFLERQFGLERCGYDGVARVIHSRSAAIN